MDAREGQWWTMVDRLQNAPGRLSFIGHHCPPFLRVPTGGLASWHSQKRRVGRGTSAPDLVGRLSRVVPPQDTASAGGHFFFLAQWCREGETRSPKRSQSSSRPAVVIG